MGVNKIQKVKEKRSVVRKAKEKIQAAPKELLRRGLLIGTEKLKGQLRDAVDGGRREDTEADHAQDAAQAGVQRAVGRLGKLGRGKKGDSSRPRKARSDADVPEAHADTSVPGSQTGADIPASRGEPVRIKTRETASAAVPVERRPSVSAVQHAIKTRETSSTCRQMDNPMEGATRSENRGQKEFVRERGKTAFGRRAESHCGGASSTRGHSVDSAPARRPTAQMTGWNEQSVNTPTRKAADEGKKAARPGQRATGRAIHQRTEAAVNSAPKAVKTAEHSRQVVRQAAHATVQAQRRAVRAADGARWATATVGRPVAKAAVSALRGAASAIRAAMAPLAAGGGAVIAVVLVLCLVGALLLSPLGILFSGEENSGQTTADAVREINREYSAKLEGLQAGATCDEVRLSGSRAPWPEVLAVYAVKTTSDPTNGQEVVTMTDEKRELLKRVFWDMNQVAGFTSTVPNGDDEGETTTLHITITAKTAYEMADIYCFNATQRQQLMELLSDEYRELWNAVLYGTGSSEIVAVALSQVGNVGGQPYWSWYGFDHRVDWCAIFVSWCANECGYIDAGVIPKFAGCVQGSHWFKNRGQWQDRSYTPNPGDLIFFDWDNPGGFSGPQDSVPDHVGIVERVENGRVYTIEGNSGDKCCQRNYPVMYYEIYGYGTPEQ